MASILQDITLCKCEKFKIGNFFGKKKNKEEEIDKSKPLAVDPNDIVFDITDKGEYQSLQYLNYVSHDITDYYLFSAQKHCIFIYGKNANKFNLTPENMRNKLIKTIMPLSHQLFYEESLARLKEEKIHHQRLFAYGKDINAHDYFPLFDKEKNLIGVFLMIRKVEY